MMIGECTHDQRHTDLSVSQSDTSERRPSVRPRSRPSRSFAFFALGRPLCALCRNCGCSQRLDLCRLTLGCCALAPCLCAHHSWASNYEGRSNNQALACAPAISSSESERTVKVARARAAHTRVSRELETKKLAVQTTPRVQRWVERLTTNHNHPFKITWERGGEWLREHHQCDPPLKRS